MTDESQVQDGDKLDWLDNLVAYVAVHRGSPVDLVAHLNHPMSPWLVSKLVSNRRVTWGGE